MSEYIPKVGEAFEWETLGGWNRETEVVFETKKQVVVINRQGFIDVISKDIEFRPVPTKADIERVQLSDILYQSLPHADADFRAREIQEAGFTIPKKITFRDLSLSMVGYDMNHNLEQWWHEEGKDLLGDLVESDL